MMSCSSERVSADESNAGHYKKKKKVSSNIRANVTSSRRGHGAEGGDDPQRELA